MRYAAAEQVIGASHGRASRPSPSTDGVATLPRRVRRSSSDDNSPDTVPVSTRTAIRRKLLAWYDRHQRNLPWRHRENDPYAQWVAEIMLQQTRVETVAAYYVRFLGRFPTLAAIAQADHDDVLKYWEGLGYYRRILNLHRAARLLVDAGDAIPCSAAGLRELPGIGEYTAAAISSIAFGEPVAAVDGNVARVVARLFAIEADVLSNQGRGRVQQLASQLLARRRPGDFNQAWMDLASLVCAPRTPACTVCPLAKHCLALEQGLVERLPVRGRDRVRRVPELIIVAGILVHGDRVLVRRRPQGGLWSGLWELPNLEVDGRVTTRHLRRLAGNNGARLIGRARKTAVVDHRLTHRRLRFHPIVSCAEPVIGEAAAESRRWATPDMLARLSISTAHRKVLEAAREMLGVLEA